MIASISGIAYLAARITDSGLPPDADPGLQVPGLDRRKYPLVGKGRARRTPPMSRVPV